MTATGRWVRATAMTHRGAVRPGNEDAIVLGGFTACGVTMAAPVRWQATLDAPVLIAVADGMGGHRGGEVASAHAVRRLAAAGPSSVPETTAALGRIDEELLAMSGSDPTLAGLGTTVAGLVLGPGPGLWFTVGDSRIYRERAGYVAQLSVDDRSELSGALVQCLGGRGDGAPLQPRVEALEVAQDGRWLLCSDGLTDLVDDGEIEGLLAVGDPIIAVRALWAAAMDASGRDNISIVLVEVVGAP